MSEPRTDPPGTVYGTRRLALLRLPQDPLMRIALGVAVVGVLLGAIFATGVLVGGGSDRPVVPAAAVTSPAESEPSVVEPTTETAPTTEPSPTEAPLPPPAGGPAVFRGVPSGRCLGVAGENPEGALAVLADCTGDAEQRWVATPVTDDVFTLVNAGSEKCLDVSGVSTDDGAPLQQWSCNGQANQQWRLAPAGAGAVLLVAVHSGKCAQVADAGTEPGAQLQQAPCTGAAEQQWALG